MIVFPNCKINLGLVVTGKRNDGYHNIETIFYPVQLNDVLEIIHSPAHTGLPPVFFSHSGILIGGDEKDNLCSRAWHMLKGDFPQLPDVKIHLHKAIPLGAGLGGGSSDAAFTLLALNEKYGLGLSQDQLSSYALRLGSDCPFFILNKPCVGKGRGEILHTLNLTLSGYHLVMVNPAIHINTPWAFSQISISPDNPPAARSLETIIMRPVAAWKDELKNDFEIPVFKKYPEVKTIRDQLYYQGALFSSMSGSGSTVYGIFNKASVPTLDFPKNYFLRTILL